MFRPLGAEEIFNQWERLGTMLAPAVRQSPNGMAIQQVFSKLMIGQCLCFAVEAPGVEGVLVFEIFDEDGKVKCFSSYIAGHVAGGPRRWVATMRAIMAELERRLAAAGCVENYIGGRDWSRVFPDYLPVDDVPNRLRKVL